MRFLSILLAVVAAATLVPRLRGESLAAPPLRRLPPVAPPTGSVLPQLGILPAGVITQRGARIEQPGTSSEWLPPPDASGETAGGEADDMGETFRLEDLAWRSKGLKIVPYGAIWGDVVYATQRNNPGAFTLWIYSRDQQDEDAFAIDARRSRFGVDVDTGKLARLGGAASRGRIEIDFFGDFITENRANLRLRHAYWELENDSYRLLFGQTWDVVSPLLPNTLNLGSGWTAGNIGFRRTQLRAERYWTLSDVSRVTLQSSLSQEIVTDFPMDPGVQRETSNWPNVEGRLAWTLGRSGIARRPATIGVSGFIGETGFDFLAAGPPPLNLPPADDVRFGTWAANLDLYLPLTARLGFQGELFMGKNLSAYFGGIGQGVCPCNRMPIRSRGGWGELWYDWTPRLHTHAGYGLDDPRNEDFLFGRTYNQFIFANFLVDVSQRLSTGLEVSYWKTLYQDRRVGLIPPGQLAPTAPGKSVVFDWMTKFAF